MMTGMVEETLEAKLKRHEDALVACMAEITKLRGRRIESKRLGWRCRTKCQDWNQCRRHWTWLLSR